MVGYNLESKIPEEVQKIVDLFSNSQIYQNMLNTIPIKDTVLILMRDRDFAKKAGIKYSALNGNLIRTAIFVYDCIAA